MRSGEGAARARGAPRPWDPNCHLRRHPRSLQAPGRAPGLTRARRSASRDLRAGLPSPGSGAAASGAEPVSSRLAPRLRSRLPLRPRRSRRRSQWSRVHPRCLSPPGPRPEVDTPSLRHSQPQPASPRSALAALDTGNSWVLDSGSPRPPSSVNSACFSTKWRPRSRAHVAAFPLPVPISPFAARPVEGRP